MSKKLPYLQFYPGEWKRDVGVQALTYEERGIWFELLLLMHDSSERGKLLVNGLPISDDTLAKVLGISSNKWKKVKTKLIETRVVSYDISTGLLYSRKMVRDEVIRELNSINGALGGNPALKKSAPVHRAVNLPVNPPIPTPPIKLSSSSSSSSSSTASINNTPSLSPSLELLVQFGNTLRMTTSEMEACILKFGKPLVDQEIPEADIWLSRADTTTARKYRKPDFNHYNFFRVTWMPNKKLAMSKNGHSKPSAFEANLAERERLLAEEKQDERT